MNFGRSLWRGGEREKVKKTSPSKPVWKTQNLLTFKTQRAQNW